MAKDLGNLNISVTADQQSFRDAGKEASKGAGGGTGVAGGLGSIIRGTSGGGVAGGLQAGANVVGMLKLAAGIGVAIAGFMLLKKTIRSIISTFKGLMNQVESATKKYGQYNAKLAVASAMAHIHTMRRDITSGGRLSGLLGSGMESVEHIKDAFRPVKDAWMGIKSSILTQFEPILTHLGDSLRLLTIKIVESMIWLQGKGLTPTRVAVKASSYAGFFTAILTGNRSLAHFFKIMAGPRPMSDAEKEMIELLEALKKSLEKQNDNFDDDKLNLTLAQPGITLSGGAWDPWSTP